MDERIRQLLAQMPERPPRSKLAGYAEVIRELRRKRRTYREIAAFFREHLQLSVAPSTLHDFVKTRSRQARNPGTMPELPPPPAAPSDPDLVQPDLPAPAAAGGIKTVAKDDVRGRIRALKNQTNPPAQAARPAFVFNADQPLALNPKKEK